MPLYNKYTLKLEHFYIQTLTHQSIRIALYSLRTAQYVAKKPIVPVWMLSRVVTANMYAHTCDKEVQQRQQ